MVFKRVEQYLNFVKLSFSLLERFLGIFPDKVKHVFKSKINSK